MRNKTIVNFGDSIFGNTRAPEDISTYIANQTGATVYNVGFGGCRMGEHAENWDCFSMYRLADAITTSNWSLQDNAINDTEWNEPSYFDDSLELLKSIDFNTVDIITIAYGTNDFTSGNPISKLEDALKYSIETIQNAYPDINIVVCSPTYRFWVDSSNYAFLYDSNSHEINGQKLTDFVEKIKVVANEYGLVYIDNYNDSGICYDNITKCFPAGDGTHHNKVGRKMIAENMAKELYKQFG